MTNPDTILAMWERDADPGVEESRWARTQLRELAMLCDDVWVLTTWADAAARKAALCGSIEECEQDAMLAADLYRRANVLARERLEAAVKRESVPVLVRGGGR